MQPAVGIGATATAGQPSHHTIVHSLGDDTTAGATAPPTASSSSSQSQFATRSSPPHNRNPSPLIFMNHTPRTLANTTTIVHPCARTATTRSTHAELFYEDGAPSPSEDQLQGVEHVHLLEGRSIPDDAATAEQKGVDSKPRRRNNGPFPTNGDTSSSSSSDVEDDGERDEYSLVEVKKKKRNGRSRKNKTRDGNKRQGSKDYLRPGTSNSTHNDDITASSTISKGRNNSGSRERSGSGSPCWWNLPDQPFWPEFTGSTAAANRVTDSTDANTDGGASATAAAATATEPAITTSSTAGVTASTPTEALGPLPPPSSSSSPSAVPPLFNTTNNNNRKTERAVLRKPLRVDTSVGGGSPIQSHPIPHPHQHRRPSLPIQTLSNTFSAAAATITGPERWGVHKHSNNNNNSNSNSRPPTRGRRFSWDTPGDTPPAPPLFFPGSGGNNNNKNKKKMTTTTTTTTATGAVPRPSGGLGLLASSANHISSSRSSTTGAAAMAAAAAAAEEARFQRFDLADFLRNTGPESAGLAGMGMAGAGRRSGGVGGGGGGNRKKHKSALRFLGYKRRKSLAERVGTVEG